MAGDDHDAPTKAAQRASSRPRRIGAYHLGKPLGEGAYGVVYEAKHPLLGRVALKVLRGAGAIEVRQFVREGTLVLDHPAIPRILDHGEVAGQRFLAQELADGLPLHVLVGPIPIAERRAVELALQVTDVLEYAHARGIIHRDLKPANIIVGKGDRVHVLDFGVAKIRTVPDIDVDASLGTPAYTAPEQLMRRAVGPSSDLYSLGVILYYLVTGGLPIVGDSPATLRAAVLGQDPVPLAERRPGLTPAFCQLVARLLAKDPARRPRSASAVTRSLRAILGGLHGAGTAADLAHAAGGMGAIMLLTGSERIQELASIEEYAGALGFTILRGAGDTSGGPHHALEQALGAPVLRSRPTRQQVLDAWRAAVAERCRSTPLLLVIDHAHELDDGTIDAIAEIGHSVGQMRAFLVLLAPAEPALAGLARLLDGHGCLLWHCRGAPVVVEPMPPRALSGDQILDQARAAAERWAPGLEARRLDELLRLRNRPEAERLETLTRRATLHRAAGAHAKARPLLKRALAIAQTRADATWSARALRELGIVALDCGNAPAARDWFRQAMTFAAGSSDRTIEAECWNSLGAAVRACGDRPEAISHFERSVALLRDHGAAMETAPVLNNLGVCYAETGRIEEARSCQEAAIAIHKVTGDRVGQSTCLVNLGNVMATLGQPDAARRLYEEAVAMRRQLGDPLLLARALTSLAILMGSQGESEAALALDMEAIALARDLDQQALVAGNLEHIAFLDLDLGRIEEAESRARESLVISFSTGNLGAQAIALRLLAEIDQRRGRTEPARAGLERAFDLARRSGDPVALASIQSAIGVARVRAGDASGIDLLRDAVARADALGAGELAVEARLDLARALRDMGSEEAAAVARDAAEMGQRKHLRKLGSEAMRLWESFGS